MTAPTPVDVVETHCPYCALQCGIVARTSPTLSVVGNRAFPVNAGALCAKGWNAAAVVDHPERLREPLARDRAGRLVPVGWRYALDRIALGIRDTIRTHGADAVGVLGSGALTNEKAYLLGKFARVAVGTANIDYNGRFCMSSGAAAANKAFGLDRGLPFPLEDLADADVILLVGSNPAETMPPFMQYFEAQQARGGALIVVDPRRTATAQLATLHLQLDARHRRGARQRPAARAAARRPGRPGLHRASAPRASPRSARVAAGYWPERVERITGVPEKTDRRSGAPARHVARAAMVLTGARPRAAGAGRRQRARLHQPRARAAAAAASRAAASACLTGQGNGQGGREHGQKADQLPGYRSIERSRGAPRTSPASGASRRDSLPGPGKSAYELLDELRHRRRRPRASSSWARTRWSRRRRRTSRSSGSRRSTSSSSPTSSCRRRRARRRRPAVRAVGGGRRHDDQPRRPRHPPQRAVAPPIGVALGHRRPASASPSASASAAHFAYGTPRRRVRRAARAPRKGAPADYSGITYAKIDAQRGVFWPCPSPEHTGHAAPLRSSASPTPSGRARFHAGRAQAAGRGARRGLPALPDHRPRPRPVPVGHADAPRRRAERDVGHEPSPRSTRRRRRA